jgi:hypothetical protein
MQEYKALKGAANGKQKEPTKSRILEYARKLAWVDGGSEQIEVDNAILNEDVIIVRKKEVTIEP